MILITMRLADMRRVHPGQIVRHCADCGSAVGIYPSGQHAIKTNPGIRVVCQVCHPPNERSKLVPGALLEPLQSVEKK